MAKLKKINFKSKKTWKNILVVGLACLTIVGAIVGLSALFRKSEETTKVINPTYAVGGLTDDGKYKETEESIYTKDAFECQGLDVDLDFRSNISYRIFFYDNENDFLSSTAKLTSNYDEETTPMLARYARIVITPNDDTKVSWYEKGGYAEQLTIRVNKEQNFKIAEEYSVDLSTLKTKAFFTNEEYKENFLASDTMSCVILDVSELKTIYSKVRIEKDATRPNLQFCFITTTDVAGGEAVPYCAGSDFLNYVEDVVVDIPADCNAIYFTASDGTSNFLPADVIFYN
ncbi:MAG: hypothetical protein IJY90_01725 [Clostridia bacterium]|nr:hypothetical protein [Clostridia bacterium]